MARFRPAAVAFDLDGTIYLSERPLPGVGPLLDHLRGTGLPYLFATNNSSYTAQHYVERLVAMGFPASREQVVTSNDVAAAHLLTVGIRRAYLVATDEVRAEYAATGVEHAEYDGQAVVLTFDSTIDYQKIVAAATLIRAGLPYFATHPDLVCPTPAGPIPDCGSFIALFDAATGRRPQILGKPSASMAITIRHRLNVQAEVDDDRIAFVGDRLYTDVRMANDHGFFAVLTLTGEATREQVKTSAYQPDLVVADLSEYLLTLSGDAAAATTQQAASGEA